MHADILHDGIITSVFLEKKGHINEYVLLDKITFSHLHKQYKSKSGFSERIVL